MYSSYSDVLVMRPGTPYSMYDGMDDSSSDYSRSSGSHYEQSSATSVGTRDVSMRSASPAPSVVTMTTSLREEAYRTEFGRNVNNRSDVYRLPADEEELRRLDHQHKMFKEIMGQYPPGLEEVLADSRGERKACVDFGCGSGSWILEVAKDFPHCDCVAVDLVPMQTTELPDNCRSEVDDINLGLQHYDRAFNVVHARLICTGIRDFAALIDQFSSTLRSGGLLNLTEYNFIIHDENKRPIFSNENEMKGPWLPRWMSLAQKAIRRQGGDVDAADHLYRWVSQHGAFESVVHRSFWFQASPWKRGNDPETMNQNRISTVMREDMLAFLKSGRPLLLGAGFPEDLVRSVEGNARQELLEARTPLYILIENVYARRRPD